MTESTSVLADKIRNDFLAGRAMTKPFIIAEIGSNWKTLDDCLECVRLSKIAGADAVKFQLFDNDALYGKCERGMVVPLQNPGHSPHLDRGWLPALKNVADTVGIQFMCSAFSVELLNAVDPFVKRHKIASAEMTHVRMLERLAEIGKPVILSTGAKSLGDIGMALNALKYRDVTIMYCAASYPAREVDLDIIDKLRSNFGVPVGYSDHTLDVIQTPRSAFREHRAVAIEKHVNPLGIDSADSPHSLSLDEFGRMVESLQSDRKPRVGPTREERDFVLRHNRRIVATCEIKPGDRLVEGENFGIYRSLIDDAHAFSPFLINEINGREARKTIKAWHGIGPGDC